MRIKSYGLNFYVDRLKTGSRYSFSRYGNGEWGCILGTARRTGSGSQSLTSADLRRGLVDSLIQRRLMPDRFFLGIQSPGYLNKCGLLRGIETWQQTFCSDSQIAWHDGNVFHHASMRGTLYPLIAQLRKMNLIVVGPPWLKDLKKQVFLNMKFVHVRPRDCFDTYKDIYAGIKRALKACPAEKGLVVISFSAGPTTKVLIHRLHDRVREGCFLLDTGSLWDVYVGKQTRKYHKRVTAEIRRRNLND